MAATLYVDADGKVIYDAHGEYLGLGTDAPATPNRGTTRGGLPEPISEELLSQAREAARRAEQELREALYALYEGRKPEANAAIAEALERAEVAEIALEQTDHESLLAHVRHLQGDISTALNAVTLQITKVRHAILVAKEIEERMAEEEAVVSMLLH